MISSSQFNRLLWSDWNLKGNKSSMHHTMQEVHKRKVIETMFQQYLKLSCKISRVLHIYTFMFTYMFGEDYVPNGQQCNVEAWVNLGDYDDSSWCNLSVINLLDVPNVCNVLIYFLIVLVALANTTQVGSMGVHQNCSNIFSLVLKETNQNSKDVIVKVLDCVFTSCS